MPTYEYRCLSCSHTFEAFQTINALPLTECPQCGKEVKRLISAGAGILFKGNGFYITDYRSKGYQEQVKKEADSTKPASEPNKTASSETTPQPAKTESAVTSP